MNNMRNEILDRILTLLMFKNVPEFDSIYKKKYSSDIFTLNDIVELMPDYELEDWTINDFKDELLSEG